MDEDVFRQVVCSLRRAGIPFWVDFGTLLGLVREGRVLPWDTDYDISVWGHETTERAVIDAFDSKEFKVYSWFSCGGAQIFVSPRKPIKRFADISFYARQDDRAILRSYLVWEGSWTRLLRSVERFLDPQSVGDKRYKRWLDRLFHRGLLPIVPPIVRRQCRRGFDQLRRRNHHKGICYVYDFPAHFLERFRTVSFLGVEVEIPEDAEGYLEAVYGADWRTPRIYTHWYDGATRVE